MVEWKDLGLYIAEEQLLATTYCYIEYYIYHIRKKYSDVYIVKTAASFLVLGFAVIVFFLSLFIGVCL